MSSNKKTVFIGNSIVKGFPHRKSVCFVSILRKMTDLDLINKGVNGDSTDGILERFNQDVISCNPDAVVILTGTNDFIFGGKTPEYCMDRLKSMCVLAENKGIRPIILTPLLSYPEMASEQWMPELNTDYSRVNEQISQLGTLIRASGLEYCDVGPDFCRQASGREEQYYYDGIHPTEKGHVALAEIMYSKLVL